MKRFKQYTQDLLEAPARIRKTFIDSGKIDDIDITIIEDALNYAFTHAGWVGEWIKLDQKKFVAKWLEWCIKFWLYDKDDHHQDPRNNGYKDLMIWEVYQNHSGNKKLPNNNQRRIKNKQEIVIAGEFS